MLIRKTARRKHYYEKGKSKGRKEVNTLNIDECFEKYMTRKMTKNEIAKE